MDQQRKIFASVFCMEVPLHLWEQQMDEHRMPALLLTGLTGCIWWVSLYAMSVRAHRRIALPLLVVTTTMVAAAGAQAPRDPWLLAAAVIMAIGVLLTTRASLQLTRAVEALSLGILALAVIMMSTAWQLPPQVGAIRWTLLALSTATTAVALGLIFFRGVITPFLYAWSIGFGAVAVVIAVDPFAQSLNAEPVGVLSLLECGFTAVCARCHQRRISLNALLLPVGGGLVGALVGVWSHNLLIMGLLSVGGAAAGIAANRVGTPPSARLSRAALLLGFAYTLGGAHFYLAGQLIAAMFCGFVGLAFTWFAYSTSVMSAQELRAWS